MVEEDFFSLTETVVIKNCHPEQALKIAQQFFVQAIGKVQGFHEFMIREEKYSEKDFDEMSAKIFKRLNFEIEDIDIYLNLIDFEKKNLLDSAALISSDFLKNLTGQLTAMREDLINTRVYVPKLAKLNVESKKKALLVASLFYSILAENRLLPAVPDFEKKKKEEEAKFENRNKIQEAQDKKSNKKSEQKNAVKINSEQAN